MATLNFGQLQQLLTTAGMDSASAAIGAAIALAESGGQTDKVGDNGSSFGLWQIHLPAHPEVSQGCAFDPACAASAVLRISSGGTNWQPWTTFQTGAYQAFLGAQQAVQKVVQWAVTLRFGQPGPNGETEHGTDVAVPVGTDFVSPFSGTVTLLEDKKKQDWGKRVLITIDQGPLAGLRFGVGHLTAFGVSLGQHVNAGDVLGQSGGAASDPSSGESTGPHVEVQFLNAASQFIDPEQVLASLGIGIGSLFKTHGAANPPGLPNPFGGAQGIAQALQLAAYLLLGLALIWFGLVLVIIGSIPWDKAARVAAAVTPEGKVASTVAGAAGA